MFLFLFIQNKTIVSIYKLILTVIHFAIIYEQCQNSKKKLHHICFFIKNKMSNNDESFIYLFIFQKITNIHNKNFNDLSYKKH